MYKRMKEWLEKRTENVPNLQNFVPFWSRCLKKGQFWEQGSHRSRSGRRKKRRGRRRRRMERKRRMLERKRRWMRTMMMTMKMTKY